MLCYALLLVGARWSTLSLFQSIPLTFVGIGVLLSLVFLRIDEKRFVGTIWRLYVGIFSIMFLAIFTYPFIVGSWLVWVLAPGAWIAWTVIVGCVLVGVHPQEQPRPRSWSDSPKVRMILSQVAGLLTGLFIYARSAQYGLPAVIVATCVAIIVILYSFNALKHV